MTHLKFFKLQYAVMETLRFLEQYPTKIIYNLRVQYVVKKPIVQQVCDLMLAKVLITP
jgi:hypothetical protein